MIKTKKEKIELKLTEFEIIIKRINTIENKNNYIKNKDALKELIKLKDIKKDIEKEIIKEVE